MEDLYSSLFLNEDKKQYYPFSKGTIPKNAVTFRNDFETLTEHISQDLGLTSCSIDESFIGDYNLNNILKSSQITDLKDNQGIIFFIVSITKKQYYL